MKIHDPKPDLVEKVLKGKLIDFIFFQKGEVMTKEFRQVGKQKFLITINHKNQVTELIEIEND